MGKGGTTIGYHYLLTLVMNVCRGPINELVEIHVGDEVALRETVDDDTPTRINKPELFGGEKREGGIQGVFRMHMGADAQVLPGESATTFVGYQGPYQEGTVPDIKSLIGVPMGELRGFVTLIYDGLVTSMSPYPKEWKMRLRRHSEGWYGGACWYPAKAKITLVGDGNYPADDDGAEIRAALIEKLHSGAIAHVTMPGEIITIFLGLVDEAWSRYVPPLEREIHAMNPAHIIYQCLTDPLWGAGQPVDAIDENSFILAANTLCSEGFGLCFNWARQESVDTFIQVVIDHIGGVIYNDRETGKYVLRLIRNDYDVDDLPIYTFSTGLLSIEDEDNASDEEGINEVIVTAKDPVQNEKLEVRTQNIAALAANGGETISHSVEYKGAPTRALAMRLAQRDLRSYTAGLKRYKITLDRRAWRLAPGGVIRVQAPERGIADVVLRLGTVDYGDLEDGQISCSTVEDVFGMPETAFTEVVSGGYSSIPQIPLPSPLRALVEANYRDVYRTIGATEANNLSDTTSVIAQLALSPIGTAITYDLASKAAGETSWRVAPEQGYTAFAQIDVAITASQTTVEVVNNYDLDNSFIGEALLLGGADGEIVRLDGITGSTLTIARGCADTVPSAHPAGTSVWALDDNPGIDGREYALGETVSTQVRMRVANAVLDEDLAPTDTLVVAGRQAMPYPPGNVAADGASIYSLEGVYDEPVITWVARDRIAQADTLIAFGAGGVGPEPGTTYRIRVYDPADLSTPLRTITGLTASPWTYDATMQTADALPAVVVRLDSMRDGIGSWQPHEFTVQVEGGYGLCYGWDYGGA